jgi:hypothetical protein
MTTGVAMPAQTPMSLDVAYQLSGFKHIEVEITSLTDFAAVLRREVAENLQPCIDRVAQSLDKPYFGNDTVLELTDVRDKYNDYMAEAKEFLRLITLGVQQMADAADKVAAKYSESDQFAKIQADDVNSVLPVIASGSRNYAV